MPKRIFFSAHADNVDLIEKLHELLTLNWALLDGPFESRSIEKYCEQFVALTRDEMPNKVRGFWKSARVQTAAVQNTAYVLLAHAAFGEALRRWPKTRAVIVEFQEQHAFAVDSQMRFYELTGDRACFFALMHVCLGDICESQQDPGSRELRQIAVKIRGKLDFLDVFNAAYRNIRQVAETDAPPAERLRKLAKELLFSAEIFLGTLQLFH